MAFIRCPECGAENNELAPTCFRCGFPLKSKQDFGNMDTEPIEQYPPETFRPEPAYSAPAPAPVSEVKKKGLDLKLLLIMILGGVVWSLALVWSISRYNRFLPMMFAYILGDSVMLCAMFFGTMKKKVVAIILAATGILFTILLPLLGLLTEWFRYAFRYGGMDARMVLSMVVSLFFAVLLLLYTLMGEKHRDSIVWMLVFIGLVVFNRVLNTGWDMFTLLLSFLMCAFYVIGYSPAKWYNRKQS